MKIKVTEQSTKEIELNGFYKSWDSTIQYWFSIHEKVVIVTEIASRFVIETQDTIPSPDYHNLVKADKITSEEFQQAFTKAIGVIGKALGSVLGEPKKFIPEVDELNIPLTPASEQIEEKHKEGLVNSVDIK